MRPDGYIIQGEQLLPDGDWTSGCDHMIVIPEDKLRISIGYRRVFLKDWKKIEQLSRELPAEKTLAVSGGPVQDEHRVPHSARGIATRRTERLPRTFTLSRFAYAIRSLLAQEVSANAA